MKKSELIEMCKYYKDENICPYEGSDNNKSTLWNYERAWVYDSLNKTDYTEIINDYSEVGLLLFNASDNIPTSYKSLLFNRLSKGSLSMIDSVPYFKEFYNIYYS